MPGILKAQKAEKKCQVFGKHKKPRKNAGYSESTKAEKNAAYF